MIDPIIIIFFYHTVLAYSDGAYGDDFYRPLEPRTSYSNGSLKLTESLFPGCSNLYLLPCHLLRVITSSILFLVIFLSSLICTPCSVF